MSYKKERLILLVKVLLIKYFDIKVIKSKNDFIKYLNSSVKSKNITGDESKRILKHFEKEIFLLDKNIVMWMLRTLRKDEINFNSKFKQFKKLIENGN